MGEPCGEGPSFSLWHEPWIGVEDMTGAIGHLGIEQALLECHTLRSLFDPSPLVTASIHRLLAAVLQAAHRPERPADLAAILRHGRFRPDVMAAFGRQFASRFDLFSETAPFLQSADLPLKPQKGDDLKSVSQLALETSRSTALAHYRHGRAMDEFFCAPCAAAGLATIPPFISSGGAGLKPSINGVPPVYVMPGGESLFHSLALSLVLPGFQPAARSTAEDLAWWVREPIVEHGREVGEVGYLHSLTFPARRVRLHPEPMDRSCTRCGGRSAWGVRTMIFEMGESRPKDAPFWQDPFAGYKVAADKPPVPIRPTHGKALWREYSGLFLAQHSSAGATAKEGSRLRPRILDQIAELGLASAHAQVPLRCIGVRTDMKAKVFEWIDAGFEVPPVLLRDEDAALHVAEALRFASDSAAYASAIFKLFFGKSTKHERFQTLRVGMVDGCWAGLAGPFRTYTLELARTAPLSWERVAASRAWGDGVVRAVAAAFHQAAAETGEGAEALLKQVQSEQRCAAGLSARRKEYWKGE